MVTAEEVFGALNADHKDLTHQYYYRLFKCLESVERITNAELWFLLSTYNDIFRDFGSDNYIHSSTSSMIEKFVLLN